MSPGSGQTRHSCSPVGFSVSIPQFFLCLTLFFGARPDERSLRPGTKKGGPMKKSIPALLALLCVLFTPNAALAGGNPAYALSFGGDLCLEVGAEVEVVIYINDAPNDADAIGMDISYNTSVLSYKGVIDRGDLTQAYVWLLANEVSPGDVRIGGIQTPGAIPTGASGSMAVLHFDVIGEGDCGLGFISVIDDVAGWSNVSNACECALTPDVELDGSEMIIYGGASGDAMAVPGSAAPMDLNGDGIKDIVLSSPLATTLGRAGAGALYIYYGSDSLAGARDVAGIAGTAPDVIISGASAGDGIGGNGALCIADLNGDKLGDIAVGSPDADPSGRTDAGAVWVVYGSKSLGSSIDLATDADVFIEGAADGDALSQDGCLAAGDVNGDRKDDLIMGAPAANPDGRADAGALYILYGCSCSGTTVDLAAGGQNVTILGDAAGAGLAAGRALAIGDLNGDCRDDIAVGGRNRAPFGAGKAYVILGSASLPASVDIASNAQDITLEGSQADDFLTGEGALCFGDVNGDGYDDLLAGASGADPGGLSGAGAVYVVYGGSAVSGTFDISANGQDLIIKGREAGSGLSGQGALFANDINGDGVADIVMGAPTDDPEGRADAGSLFVVFGSGSLPASLDLSGGDEDLWIKGAAAGDFLGDKNAIAFGDPNADGLKDLIFGSGAASPDGLAQAGQAYIVYGDEALGGAKDLAAWNQDVSLSGIDAGDALTAVPWDPRPGGGIVLADFNGDGTDDLLLGAPYADGPSDARDGSGEAYLVLGKSPCDSATDKSKDHGGNPKGRRYGTIRIDIDFESGDNLSTTVAKLNKANDGLNLPNPSKVADVYWEISSDRSNFTAVVTFRYLDEEIIGLVESNLNLYWSATKDGPWTKVTTTLDTETNTITVSGMTDKFGFFMIQDDEPVPEPTCFIRSLCEPLF